MSGGWRYLRSGYGSKNADFDIVSALGGRVASTPYEDKARLIAAAPDLLEALENIANRVAYELGDNATPTLTHYVEQARVAIAKASHG